MLGCFPIIRTGDKLIHRFKKRQRESLQREDVYLVVKTCEYFVQADLDSKTDKNIALKLVLYHNRFLLFLENDKKVKVVF